MTTLKFRLRAEPVHIFTTRCLMSSSHPHTHTRPWSSQSPFYLQSTIPYGSLISAFSDTKSLWWIQRCQIIFDPILSCAYCISARGFVCSTPGAPSVSVRPSDSNTKHRRTAHKWPGPSCRGGEEKCLQNFARKPRRQTATWEDIDTDGRIILKPILG